MKFNVDKHQSRFVDAHISNLTLKSERTPQLQQAAAEEMARRVASLSARQRQAKRIQDVSSVPISTSNLNQKLTGTMEASSRMDLFSMFDSVAKLFDSVTVDVDVVVGVWRR